MPEQRHHITHVTSPIISPYFLTTSNSLPAITPRGDDRRVGEFTQEKKNVQVVSGMMISVSGASISKATPLVLALDQGNRCELVTPGSVEPPAAISNP